MTPPFMAIALLAAHFLFDWCLQGEFVSHAKNRKTPLNGVPWYWAMAAHSSIHGAAVAFISGLWWLFLPEMILHWITDDAKCHNKLTYDQDQIIHLLCKCLWWIIAISIPTV